MYPGQGDMLKSLSIGKIISLHYEITKVSKRALVIIIR